VKKKKKISKHETTIKSSPTRKCEIIEMSIKKIHTSQEKSGQLQNLLFSFQLSQISLKFPSITLCQVSPKPQEKEKKCCGSVVKILKGSEVRELRFERLCIHRLPRT
jgi:hypothetical protein